MGVEIGRKNKLLSLFLGPFPLCYLIDLYPKQFKKDVSLLFRGLKNFYEQINSTTIPFF